MSIFKKGGDDRKDKFIGPTILAIYILLGGNTMKKMFAVLSLFVAAALVLAACGGAETPAPKTEPTKAPAAPAATQPPAATKAPAATTAPAATAAPTKPAPTPTATKAAAPAGATRV